MNGPGVNTGWAAVVRVTDQSPIAVKLINKTLPDGTTTQAPLVFEATEVSIKGANAPGREDAFFGAGLTTARPAFVAVKTPPPAYAGAINFSGGVSRAAACANDVSPPAILAIEVQPECLWPLNHKLAPFRLGDNVKVSVIDCDPNPTIRVVAVQSDENASGSFVFGDQGLCLRAARDGSGDGREYTVTIEARDQSGNASTASFVVRVPHNQSTAVCPALPGKAFVSDADARCQFH